MRWGALHSEVKQLPKLEWRERREAFFQFAVFGPQVGYFFSFPERDTQGNDVAVLSHSVWRKVFDQDSTIVGKQITLNGRSFTVLGVTPSEFLFLVRGREAHAWIPLVKDDSLVKTAQEEGRGTIARLKPGLTFDHAQARTNLLFERITQPQPQLRPQPDDRILLNSVA